MENSQILEKILSKRRYGDVKMVLDLEKNSGESATTYVIETLHY